MASVKVRGSTRVVVTREQEMARQPHSPPRRHRQLQGVSVMNTEETWHYIEMNTGVLIAVMVAVGCNSDVTLADLDTRLDALAAQYPNPSEVAARNRTAQAYKSFENRSITVHNAFRQLVGKRDQRAVHNILTQLWLDAPESREVYSWEGFNELCKVLEEGWDDPADGFAIDKSGE